MSNTLITSLAWLEWQEKSSGHPEKVSTKTSKCLNLLYLGNSEKSICQCSPGVIPPLAFPASGFCWILPSGVRAAEPRGCLLQHKSTITTTVVKYDFFFPLRTYMPRGLTPMYTHLFMLQVSHSFSKQKFYWTIFLLHWLYNKHI